MTQAEQRLRLKYLCIHGHNGLAHPKCFDKKNGPVPERIGFADIESSNLRASFGIVYSYCIKEKDGPMIARSVTLQDLHKGEYDKNLMRKFIEDAEQFDRLIFHYGSDMRFDIPFLRTRCEYWGLEFPRRGLIHISDTYPILRNKFKLHSNRLEAACDFFEIDSKGHKMNPRVWLKMISGNKRLMQQALDYILLHNKEDVLSLEKLWERTGKYSKLTKAGI